MRYNSCTHPNYIGAAIGTSAHTASMNTNAIFHRKHQMKIYNEILVKRGYPVKNLPVTKIYQEKKIQIS